MNLLKVQNQLRSVPDDALINYVQNPQPTVPSYLALSELQRRQEMREESQGQQSESSVVEDVLGKEQQGGLAAMMGGMQPQQAPQPEMPQPAPQMPQPEMVAQAPMSQQEPPVMMAEGGLASLPIDDDLYPEEFAGGGMVAFAKGGSTYDYSIPMENEDEASKDYMSKYESMLGQNQGLIDIQDRLAKQEERAKEQMEVAPWMALARAGFAIAGGKSPFALQNIGEGAQEGLKDYAAAQDRFEKANDRYLDARSKLAQADRAERAAMVSGALSAEEKAQVRNANREIQSMEAKAAMDRQLSQNATQIKAAQIQAAARNDYGQFLDMATQDPDMYKTIKGPDGKPRQVLDTAKVQSVFKSYASTTGGGSAANMLDDDTLGKIWQEKSMLPSFRKQYPTPADFVKANRAILNSPNTTQSDTWSNFQVTNPKR